jgi:hypothetical protein
VRRRQVRDLMRVLNCPHRGLQMAARRGLVRFYQSSPGFSRGVCGAWGSPITHQIEPPRVWCRAGHTRRRPERAADALLLCRKQAAVVRNHRYSSSISGATRLLLKTAADRVWPRSSAPRLGTRCCAVSRPEFRALDLTLDQRIIGAGGKCAYSWASLERRSKRCRGCSQ